MITNIFPFAKHEIWLWSIIHSYFYSTIVIEVISVEYLLLFYIANNLAIQENSYYECIFNNEQISFHIYLAIFVLIIYPKDMNANRNPSPPLNPQPRTSLQSHPLYPGRLPIQGLPKMTNCVLSPREPRWSPGGLRPPRLANQGHALGRISTPGEVNVWRNNSGRPSSQTVLCLRYSRRSARDLRDARCFGKKKTTTQSGGCPRGGFERASRDSMRTQTRRESGMHYVNEYAYRRVDLPQTKVMAVRLFECRYLST